jgi:tetratricopeptide (TPR) repeat protein
MNEPLDLDREAISRDRDLAWELFEAQPQHPRIPELVLSVLATAPELTGMSILLAMHREACGEVDEARRLLQDLMGRRDRQYLNALRRLRDLEDSAGDYDEALRLAELVLREDPEADWRDRMDR